MKLKVGKNIVDLRLRHRHEDHLPPRDDKSHQSFLTDETFIARTQIHFGSPSYILFSLLEVFAINYGIIPERDEVTKAGEHLQPPR